MPKLDFSDIQEKGFRINHLKLVHSTKFRGVNFKKNKKYFTDHDDLQGERDLLAEYLIENMEIDYTLHILFKGLTFFSFFLAVILLLAFDNNLLLPIVSVILSFIFWLLAKRRKENFVMGQAGLELSENWYNSKIKDKYNLK